MLKDSIEPSSMTELYPESISATLDRLEIPAAKIGLITAEQGFALLHGLDAVSLRIQNLEPGNPSRKVADAQLEGIISNLQKEARRFIRDLGGFQAFQRARAETNPPENHSWWYLDQWLANKRRAALKRSLVTGGAVVALLIILTVLYDKFLAPDPLETARYGYQQSATDRLLADDFAAAMREVDQGLQIAPQDPNLLVLKGVIQEKQGEQTRAAESFHAAEKGFATQEEFLLMRGQTYMMAKQPEKALADAQAAIQANPQSASAYLLHGQVNEDMQKYKEAMDDYNLAFDAANKAKTPELAALARMHIAMLTQTMNAQIVPEPLVTPVPTQ
jgi:Tfp pilus assembly protein PilF